MRRERIGHTSRRKTWMIRVDTCFHCGCSEARQPLTFEQACWLRRVNRMAAMYQVNHEIHRAIERAAAAELRKP